MFVSEEDEGKRLEVLQEIIAKMVDDVAKKRAELIESFVVVYLQTTGLRIDEVELVERMDGNKFVWYFRKKGSSE